MTSEKDDLDVDFQNTRQLNETELVCYDSVRGTRRTSKLGNESFEETHEMI